MHYVTLHFCLLSTIKVITKKIAVSLLLVLIREKCLCNVFTPWNQADRIYNGSLIVNLPEAQAKETRLMIVAAVETVIGTNLSFDSKLLFVLLLFRTSHAIPV